MIGTETVLERLRQQLGLLPGVGPKMAERLALYLLKAPAPQVQTLLASVEDARRQMIYCPECFTYTERTLCSVCADSSRDRTVVCVVENPSDLEALEKTRRYRGVYHVLHGALSPIGGVGPQDLKIQELVLRVKKGNVLEVILSTNLTVAGEMTAMYLLRLLKPMGVRISRIGSGLPMGGNMEFADELTLTRALEGRREL